MLAETNIPNQFVSALRRTALTKSGNRRYKHAAAIISKTGDVIALAPNIDGCHAEVNAILKWLNINERHKRRNRIDYLISMRFNKSGGQCNAKPCPNCQAWLDKFKIKYIYSV